MSLYALNLFDLADNGDYLAYSRRSPAAVLRHGGRVVALGMHAPHPSQLGETEPRHALVLVEWRDRHAFDGRARPLNPMLSATNYGSNCSRLPSS